MNLTTSSRRQDKVSIIIVCLNNSQDEIRFTLDSVIAQDYPRKELILMDGGSRPETLAAIKPYISALTHFVSAKDQGIYDAMNKGIAKVTGDWLAFMNIGDSYSSPDSLNRMIAVAANAKVELIYGDAALYKHGVPQWTEHIPADLNKRFLYHGMVCHQAMLIANSAFSRLGYFNTDYRIFADKDWLFRFIQSDLAAIHCGYTICNWTLGGASAASKQSRDEERTLLKNYYSLLESIIYAIYWTARRALRKLRTRGV